LLQVLLLVLLLALLLVLPVLHPDRPVVQDLGSLDLQFRQFVEHHSTNF
jgi:hypothetical protein